MNASLRKRVEVIEAMIEGTVSKQQASQLLETSVRTVENYRKRYQIDGETGLRDGRHSNYSRLNDRDEERILTLKRNDRWRSARNIVQKLNLPVHEVTVWRICRKAELNRENISRVKPLQRFEAARPNDLWQTDIMGKIDFPKFGQAYLIASIDDHSRFCLGGQWFISQNKINVFLVWYEALAHWGCPQAILQDAGSQYKARARFGTADYQWYANNLGIKLLWAKRAQTKGKVERFWKFVQSDFVKEAWNIKTLEELNEGFRKWLIMYNYTFKSRHFGHKTRAAKYQPSDRRIDQVTLRNTLAIHEQRKVTRESTISLYGYHYAVPSEYVGRRIWVKIIGNKVIFEVNDEVFWKTRLKSL